ncbi:apoptosis-stimulating of p53 protein 1-like [Physella acuta]|uniref:apoptosis-stimulating of p53 protein 1-like n=1 Tax=Physella acuta TaxID=109671 RepID=UPI0027DB97D7|nr:apoptosis-stimulating of p53 protein 1-like [Physella acuta]
MASRQQRQIESQQQVLVAKEQRLKYLKQQEARHAQVASESERLKKIRDRVESQELKLKKLRALKGQAEQYRANNENLNTELEAVKALFNEKEKELAMAVARVDQLTRQLKDLKSGVGKGLLGTKQANAAIELEKLRRELLIRNRLNEQQSNAIYTKEKLLHQHKEEVTRIDSRIIELQQRLRKQKMLEQQMAEHGGGNVIKNSETQNSANTGTKLNGIMKTGVNPYKDKFVYDKTEENTGIKRELNNNYGQFDDYNLPVVVSSDHKGTLSSNSQYHKQHPSSYLNSVSEPSLSTKVSSNPAGFNKDQLTSSQHRTDDAPSGQAYKSPHDLAGHKVPPSASSPKEQGKPGLHPVISISEEERQAGSGQSSPATSETDNDKSQSKGEEVITSSIGSVSALIEKLNKNNGQMDKTGLFRSNFTQRRPPPIHNSGFNSDKTHPEASLQPSVKTSDVDQDDVNPGKMGSNVAQSQPSPNSGLHLNQKPAPTYRYASKNQIANTYMGRLGTAAMERYQRNLNLLYRSLDTEAEKTELDKGAEETTSFSHTADASAASENLQYGVVRSPNYPDIASDKGSYKLNTPKHIRRRHSDSENEEVNRVLQETQELENQRQNQIEQAVDSNSTPTKVAEKSDSSPADKASVAVPVPEQQSQTEQTPAEEKKPEELPPPVSTPTLPELIRIRKSKSNLKQEGSRKSMNRVSFDPLALLLDGSLEGELELVKKVAVQVEDVSMPNDEGITALHNAICAGHLEIVKFLVEFGCDVNSPDSDGWTPLHCAASCNNLPMVKFLVEHGACVFATTISDHETAAEKCEEDEDGYDGCSDYLYSIQEKLGIINNGEVYGVFDYQATNVDEISFQTGDKLTVLRKGDDLEKEWWWSQFNGKEGYIPRNLLGLYPRITQKVKDVSDC